MTLTVCKYKLNISDRTQEIEMPIGSEILCVQIQYGEPVIWAKVNPDNETETIKIITVFIGSPMTGEEGRYIGTYQIREGSLVFHVFEEGE